MIESIERYQGSTLIVTTKVFCDNCGKGAQWGPGKRRAVAGCYLARRILRKEGWKSGKKDICPGCQSPETSEE